MKVMLYPNKSKFYNFLKSTPEVENYHLLIIQNFGK